MNVWTFFFQYRFDKKVATRMEQLKSGTDTAFWSLACQVQLKQYRLSHLCNLGEFKEHVDDLLDLTLKGL